MILLNQSIIKLTKNVRNILELLDKKEKGILNI